MSKQNLWFALITSSLVMLGYQNCGRLQGNSKNNGGNVFEGTSTGNPTVIEGEVVVVPFSGAKQLSLCVTETTLNPVGGGKAIKVSDDIELVIDSSGSNLGTFDLPTGQYEFIQFRLQNDCGYSVSLINTDDSVSTSNKEVKLKFNGPIEITDHGFTLDIQPVIDHLATLPPGTDIGDGMNESNGSADDGEE